MIDLRSGKNFTAELLGATSVLAQFRSVGLTDFIHIGAQDGWLALEVWSSARLAETRFHFKFIEATDDRIHYKVRCVGGTFDGAQVAASRNGYLGGYRVAEVDDCYWKIEVLADPDADDAYLYFHLRDQEGHRVAGEQVSVVDGAYNNMYLNTQRGTPLVFRLHNVHWQ